MAKKNKPGQGRKKKYGEETTTVAFRVPVSKAESIKSLVKSTLSEDK